MIAPSRRARRGPVVALFWAIAMCALLPAAAQADEPVITSDPTIGGSLVAGSTLRASGAWESEDPVAVTWRWERCLPAGGDCDLVGSGREYPLTGADVGFTLRVRLRVENEDGSDRRWSDRTGIVQAAPPVMPDPIPTPIPTPDPTPTPDPAPVPAPAPVAVPTPRPAASPTPQPVATPRPAATATPTTTPTPVVIAPTTTAGGATAQTFETPAATPPVPATTLLPPAAQPALGLLSPFPVVRIRGELTATGARITLLTIRGPRGARVRVTCSGERCPRRSWTRSRSRRLTRVKRFERNLRAGVRLTVVVTRAGTVGKYTTFRIRRGLAPLRSDGCASPTTQRRARCP